MSPPPTPEQDERRHLRTCARCGFEGRLLGGRRCERCTLADRLAVLLDDGTGRVNLALLPLFDALTSMDKPKSGLGWR